VGNNNRTYSCFKIRNKNSFEIDLTNQSKGIYLIQVITGKEVYNQKIILD
jgi:LEA14-like dessication related protein